MQNAFDVNSEAKVITDFKHAGKDYKVGEPFPHKDLGIIPYDLEGLWRAQLIQFTGRPAVASTKKKPAQEAATR